MRAKTKYDRKHKEWEKTQRMRANKRVEINKIVFKTLTFLG